MKVILLYSLPDIVITSDKYYYSGCTNDFKCKLKKKIINYLL